MNKKQLVLLFFCSLFPWTVGNGLVPLLPVYATQLGANSAMAGYYLALSYLAIALGALSAGWISDGLNRRKLPLLVSGLVAIPLVWLMGQARTIWGLAVLTAILWFFGGIELAVISILAGLSAGEKERGKIFGILALTNGFGTLVGGLATGWIVEHWGYTTMFNVMAIFLLILPLIAFFLEEKQVKRRPLEDAPDQKSPGLGRSFYLLFSASVLSAISGFFVLLIRSLVMSDQGFSPLEITSTGAVGGLMAMPLPLLMGWLSDRIDRKTFLFVGFISAFATLVVLAFSKTLWNFWIVFVLYGIAIQGNSTIGNAAVTDLLPRESLGKGLALFGATSWIGGVIGFAVSGYTLQNLGLVPTLIIGGCLALAAVGLLIPIQIRARG